MAAKTGQWANNVQEALKALSEQKFYKQKISDGSGPLPEKVIRPFAIVPDVYVLIC